VVLVKQNAEIYFRRENAIDKLSELRIRKPYLRRHRRAKPVMQVRIASADLGIDVGFLAVTIKEVIPMVTLRCFNESLGF
jgi:hypothetical protein